MERKRSSNLSRIYIKLSKPKNVFIHRYAFNIFFKNKLNTVFMIDCKKSTSEKNFLFFFKSFFIFYKKGIKKLLKYGVINSSSLFFLKVSKKSRRDIPFFLKKSLRQGYAIKLIKKTIFKNKETFFFDTLQKELLKIMQKTSLMLTNNETLLKDAIKKKSNAHFRWF